MSYQGLISAIVAVVLWGFWAFFGKLALSRGMRPVDVFLAEAFAGFALAIVVVGIGSASSAHPLALARQGWNAFGLLSGSAMVLGLFFYYVALDTGNVSIVSPLTATYPVIAVFLGSFLLREELHLIDIIAIALIIAGSILLGFSRVR